MPEAEPVPVREMVPVPVVERADATEIPELEAPVPRLVAEIEMFLLIAVLKAAAILNPRLPAPVPLLIDPEVVMGPEVERADPM